jgi:hypothetical protein
MESVVYLLGAGFSAPLGLPVMSNFLEKSKDLYFSNPQRYRYFDDVLQEIAKMSVVKNYYSTDLFNIEEILSVLAMQQSLRGQRLKKTFLSYIADVITYYTPTFDTKRANWPGNWEDQIFSSIEGPGRYFASFVANLLQLRVSMRVRGSTPVATSFQSPGAKYAVITLNYDLVLENFAQYIAEAFPGKGLLSFNSVAEPENLSSVVPLAKLHGSTDSGIMVAPTWNKALARNLLPAWKTAFRLLAEANHIRVIGYSLPTADAYIKYLLRAAAIESPHLKKIDVLCRDDRNKSVYARYADFVDFANFRFVSGEVLDYIIQTERTDLREIEGAPSVEFRNLESAHENFFTRRLL